MCLRVVPTIYNTKQCWGSGSVGFVPMFLGLLDPDPVVRGIDPDPDPSIIVRKTLIPTVLWLLFDLLSLKNYVNVPSKSNKQKSLKNIFLLASWRSMTKIAAGSKSGSISQRHGSAYPDPDPHQNVMDPQHCHKGTKAFLKGRQPGSLVNFRPFPFFWIYISNTRLKR